MRPILFAPHNDDETLFASFLCLRHRPFVIVCYRSMVQVANGITAEERELETSNALAILDVTHEQEGYGWKQWPWGDDADHADEIEGNMWGLLDPVSEDVPHVFAPAWVKGGHPQHNLIAALADNVFGAENVTNYTTYQLGGPRDTARRTEVPFEPEWIETKLRALACYRSQMERGPNRMFLDFGLREYLA